jgi:uncharacterized protein YqgV (UPF0045/DUF77 family)
MNPSLAKTVLVEITVTVPAGRSNEAVIHAIDQAIRPLQQTELIIATTFAASTIAIDQPAPPPEPEPA